MSAGDAREVFSFLQELRRQGDFYTNINMLPANLQIILDKPGTRMIRGDHSLLILEQEETFSRLHGFASGQKGVEETVSGLSSCDQIVVADIVGRAEQVRKANQQWLCPAGMVHIASLQRMSQPIPETVAPKTCGELAASSDTETLYRMLYDTFNPHISRLPTRKALAERVEKGDIYVIRRDGQIACMAMFDRLSQKVTLLEQLATHEQFRGLGLASQILQNVHEYSPLATSLQLWCVMQDKRACSFYEANGYTADGLIDCILVKGDTKYGSGIES